MKEGRVLLARQRAGYLTETIGAFYFVIELKLIPAKDNSLFVFSIRRGSVL